MIEGLKPYPAMKESGVGSLGAVPAHWKIGRIKHIAEVNPTRALATNSTAEPATFLPMERVTADGRIDPHEQKPMSQLINGFTCFRRNDVIVAKITPCFENGKGACLDQMPTAIGFGSTEFIVLRAKSMALPQFLYRLTTEAEFRRLGADSMTGSAGQQRVSQSFIANFSIAIPPVEEQRAIVRFLDHADRLIRRYVNTKRKLIKLLEEQKQAIIHRAVTRGLDPNVRLKPSGVDWLGDVPEHWQVVRVKQMSRILRGKFSHRPRNDPSLYEGPYPFIQTGDVARAKKNITSFAQTLNERGFAVSKMFPAGTLVMTIAANIGDVAVLDFEACFPDSVVGFVPNQAADRDFLYYVFKMMKSELLREAPVNTQGNLNIDRIGSRGIPVPPLAEQQNIVSFIETGTADSSVSIQALFRDISLLQEYRTRLIADVVTGKLDVRAAAAALPDEADESEEIEVSEAADVLDDTGDEEVEADEAA